MLSICVFKSSFELFSVYLRTSPEKCMERIKKRSRNEETSVSMVGSAFGGFALDISKIKAKLQTLTSGQSCDNINLIISTQFLGLVEYLCRRLNHISWSNLNVFFSWNVPSNSLHGNVGKLTFFSSASA